MTVNIDNTLLVPKKGKIINTKKRREKIIKMYAEMQSLMPNMGHQPMAMLDKTFGSDMMLDGEFKVFNDGPTLDVADLMMMEELTSSSSSCGSPFSSASDLLLTPQSETINPNLISGDDTALFDDWAVTAFVDGEIKVEEEEQVDRPPTPPISSAPTECHASPEPVVRSESKAKTKAKAISKVGKSSKRTPSTPSSSAAAANKSLQDKRLENALAQARCRQRKKDALDTALYDCSVAEARADKLEGLLVSLVGRDKLEEMLR